MAGGPVEVGKPGFVSGLPRLYRDGRVLVVSQSGHVYQGRILATRREETRTKMVLELTPLSVLPPKTAADPDERLLDANGGDGAGT